MALGSASVRPSPAESELVLATASASVTDQALASALATDQALESE